MTLIISSSCDAPGCVGAVHFDLPDRPRANRLTGRCDRCGDLYDLWGGQRRRFPSRARDPRWSHDQIDATTIAVAEQMEVRA